MKKIILLAVALLAVSNVASATNVVLVAHNQRSAGGVLSTLKWKACVPTGATTPCLSTTNAWTLANAIGSDAVWTWDPDTGVLAMTGTFQSTAFISSNANGSSVVSDKVVNLTIDTTNNRTTATSYQCIEGTFLASVGAAGCLNTSTGPDFVNDSSAQYNVGGSASCVQRTVGGDDTVTGNTRGVTATFGGVPGCDPTNDAFDFWTVVQDDDVEGGTLIISNGICQACPNANYLTFQLLAGPSAADDTVTTPLNTAVVIDVLGNDNGFADPVTVSLFTPPAQGSVAITGSPGPQAGIVLTYTPAPGFRGVETFQYAVDDGTVPEIALVSVSVGLAPSYNPVGPQTNVALATVTSGGWKQCYAAPMGTSIGPSAENVLSACQGSHLMMAGRSTGSDTFLVLATAPYTEAILNTGPNSSTHLANGSNWYFAPNHSWGFTAANDTVNLFSCDTSFSSPTSMCLHTNYGGGYRINDISSLNDSTDYEKVFFVEQIPGAYDDAGTAYLSTPVNIKVLANDVGFDSPVTVSIDDAPDNGSVVVNGSPGDPLLVYITYTPEPGFEGVDTFQYSVGDGALLDSATVTVTVKAPQALPDLALSKNATPAVIDVLANDTGFSDPVTVTLTANPSSGTAVVTGSPGTGAGIRITYTPAAGFTGQDSLQYQVTDGVNSATATVSITVTAYKAVNDTFYVLSYDSPYLYVGQNDIGFKDPVTLTILTGPTIGSAHTHDSPGPKSGVLIHYSPNYGSNYTTTMTYQLTDGVSTDTATVTINVVSYYAQDDERNTGAGIPVIVPVTENDVGFDYPRTVGLYTNPQHGQAVANNPVGCCNEPTITYTPVPGFLGDDTFQYAIDDGTRIAIATVIVHVINDADNDLVNDSLDNCVGTANADQRDADGDGYGSLCDADYNNDKLVNFGDLAMFRATFGSPNANADMDGNGVVNFADLARFKALFGKAPGPSALVP